MIDKAGLKMGLLINPWIIIIASVVIFIIVYKIVFNIFGIAFLSLLISAPALFVPTLVLTLIENNNSSKLEKIMLDFLLQLKNYTKINNDIVYALKEVKTMEPLQGYINTFLVQINSGIKFEKAIESIKEKMDFDTLKAVFSNIEYCYLYGGNFSELMDKSYQKIYKIQKEKAKRNSETKSARIVLAILILLDLIVYFSFIRSNYENYLIMTKSMLGMMILYWNFISIWILVLLMNKVKKLDY
jgi:Flp pilus assembly protein TadB